MGQQKFILINNLNIWLNMQLIVNAPNIFIIFANVIKWENTFYSNRYRENHRFVGEIYLFKPGAVLYATRIIEHLFSLVDFVHLRISMN